MFKILNWYLKLILAVALWALCNFALAEVHATLTGTTNYVWRMYSKSNNKPALQGNIDYQHASGLYTGVSLSSFNFGISDLDNRVYPGSAQLEITPYLGWSFKFADVWRFDAQYSHYFYDAKIFDLDGDYNEFYLFLHYKDLLSLQASYIDDYYGLKKDSFFYEITGRYPLTDYFEFSSGFGYAQTQNSLNSEYFYWNAGITGRYKYFAADLRYFDAKENYFPINNGSDIRPDHPKTLTATVVFTLSVGF